MQTFDIVSKIYRPSANQFNGVIWTTRAKVGMILQNYNVMDEVHLRVEAKRFTHKTMQKHNMMSFLRRCKRITSCQKVWCKIQRSTLCNRGCIETRRLALLKADTWPLTLSVSSMIYSQRPRQSQHWANKAALINLYQQKEVL